MIEVVYVFDGVERVRYATWIDVNKVDTKRADTYR